MIVPQRKSQSLLEYKL